MTIFSKQSVFSRPNRYLKQYQSIFVSGDGFLTYQLFEFSNIINYKWNAVVSIIFHFIRKGKSKYRTEFIIRWYIWIHHHCARVLFWSQNDHIYLFMNYLLFLRKGFFRSSSIFILWLCCERSWSRRPPISSEIPKGIPN